MLLHAQVERLVFPAHTSFELKAPPENTGEFEHTYTGEFEHTYFGDCAQSSVFIILNAIQTAVTSQRSREKCVEGYPSRGGRSRTSVEAREGIRIPS